MAIIRKFKKGFPIFRQDDQSRELYFIQSGSIRIFRTKKNETIELAKLVSGSIFGEMALIDGKPRSAHASAAEDSELLVIPFYEFQKHVGTAPAWFLSLLKIISIRLRRSNERLSSGKRLQLLATVAQFLVLIQKKHKNEAAQAGQTFESLDLKTVKKEMMSILGLSREPMDEAIWHLEQQDLIKSVANTLTLSDPVELESYAEFLRDSKNLENIPALEPRLLTTLSSLKNLLDTQFSKHDLVTFSLTQIRNEIIKNMELSESELEWFLVSSQRWKIAKFLKSDNQETAEYADLEKGGQIQLFAQTLKKVLQRDRFLRSGMV